MKNIFTLLLMLLSYISYSQEHGNITGNFYINNIDIKVKNYDFLGDDNNFERKSFIARKGLKFTAYEIDGGNLILKFWKFDSKADKNKVSKVDGHKYRINKHIDEKTIIPSEGYSIDSLPIVKSGSTLRRAGSNYEPTTRDEKTTNNYVTSDNDEEYFIMSLKEFNSKTSQYYGSGTSFVWGFSTIPFKLRFSNSRADFKYTTNINLGVNAGVDFSMQSRVDQSISLMLGFGHSNVDILPEEVNNTITESTSKSAFTPFVSVVYSYESFQLGLFSGFDFLQGNIANDWVYRGKPWLGIGAGFTLFQKNKTSISAGNN